MDTTASLSIRSIAPTRAWRKGDMTRKTRKTPRMGQDVGSDLCFGVSSRDRIAPDFTIRQPVRPIVALQRRVRFSPRLAGFVGTGVTRDALEGRNGPHFRFSSLISIFECHVCAK